MMKCLMLRGLGPSCGLFELKNFFFKKFFFKLYFCVVFIIKNNCAEFHRNPKIISGAMYI